MRVKRGRKMSIPMGTGVSKSAGIKNMEITKE